MLEELYDERDALQYEQFYEENDEGDNLVGLVRRRAKYEVHESFRHFFMPSLWRPLETLMKPDAHLCEHIPGHCHCHQGFQCYGPKDCDDWRTVEIRIDESKTGNSLSVYGAVTWGPMQGFQKGHVRLSLMRNGRPISDQTYGPAPEREETCQLDFTKMCEKWQRGDKLELSAYSSGDPFGGFEFNLRLFVEVN